MRMTKILAKTNRCPICNSDKYRYKHYAEECYGIVERHGYCNRCGYTVEQCYSDVFDGFMPDIKRGHKVLRWSVNNGNYYEYEPKNTRKRKRVRRKFGIKIDQKDKWLAYI